MDFDKDQDDYSENEYFEDLNDETQTQNKQEDINNEEEQTEYQSVRSSQDNRSERAKYDDNQSTGSSQNRLENTKRVKSQTSGGSQESRPENVKNNRGNGSTQSYQQVDQTEATRQENRPENAKSNTSNEITNVNEQADQTEETQLNIISRKLDNLIDAVHRNSENSPSNKHGQLVLQILVISLCASIAIIAVWKTCPAVPYDSESNLKEREKVPVDSPVVNSKENENMKTEDKKNTENEKSDRYQNERNKDFRKNKGDGNSKESENMKTEDKRNTENGKSDRHQNDRNKDFGKNKGDREDVFIGCVSQCIKPHEVECLSYKNGISSPEANRNVQDKSEADQTNKENISIDNLEDQPNNQNVDETEVEQIEPNNLNENTDDQDPPHITSKPKKYCNWFICITKPHCFFHENES